MAQRQYATTGRTQGRFMITPSRMPGEAELLLEVQDMGSRHRYLVRIDQGELDHGRQITREVGGATVTVTKDSAITGEWMNVKIDVGDGFDHEASVGFP